MDESVDKFKKLLWYFPYIKKDKAKVQRFLNFLPVPYKEMIEFENPKTMDEVVRKARLYYYKLKNMGC